MVCDVPDLCIWCPTCIFLFYLLQVCDISNLFVFIVCFYRTYIILIVFYSFSVLDLVVVGLVIVLRHCVFWFPSVVSDC